MIRASVSWGVFFALLASTATASANSGPQMSSYNAQTAGLGGADTALGWTTLTMASNPAGITQYKMRLDANILVLRSPVKMTDQVQGLGVLNSERTSEFRLFPLPAVGFSMRLGKGFHAGFLFFAQGGSGAKFENLSTFADDDPAVDGMPMPATYETRSQLAALKLGPSIAYQVAGLSLGASVHLNATSVELLHTGIPFPEPDNDGAFVLNTLDFKSGMAYSVTATFGAIYSLLDNQLRVGASYTTRSNPSLDGKLTVNGALEYDASLEGFNWGQEIAVGVAGSPFSKKLLLTGDVRWSSWSDINVMTLSASARDPASVPPELQSIALPFNIDWRDLIRVAVGAQYSITENAALRVGYNWGRVQTRDVSAFPNLFPVLLKHNVAVGAGFSNLIGGLGIDFAFEYAPRNTVTSSSNNQMAFSPALPGNAPQPNGYSLKVEQSSYFAYLLLSYDFGEDEQ